MGRPWAVFLFFEKKLTVICNTVTRKSGIGERKVGEVTVAFPLFSLLFYIVQLITPNVVLIAVRILIKV